MASNRWRSRWTAAGAGNRQRWTRTLVVSHSGAFSFHTGKIEAGNYVLSSRAVNNAGETQADTLKFNPAGYHNNVPQRIPVTVA